MHKCLYTLPITGKNETIQKDTKQFDIKRNEKEELTIMHRAIAWNLTS
jgi:hypothetical protein